MLKQIIGLTDAQLLAFILAFVRITSMVAVAPILGSQSVPVQVKVFFSLLLAFLLVPMLKSDQRLEALTLPGMTPLVLKEVTVGIFLGLIAKFLFEGFQFAGWLISTQMGLGMAQLVDPASGQPSTPISNIYGMVAIVIFLILNGHHFLLTALYRSFDVLSVGDLRFLKPAAGRQMMTMFNDLFVVGIKLAAPSMATLFLIEVCMGIMARMVPQMNIFFIGLPIRLSVGLFIIIASLPVFYVFLSSLMGVWKRDITRIITFF